MHRAYETNQVDIHAECKVRMQLSEFNDDGELETRTAIVETTVGRALLSSIVPKGLPFDISE